jgi:uncharacterized protein with HEPN domain
LTRKFDLYLKDILYSISKIERYTFQMSLEEFTASELVVDAVLENFIIIGEAVSNLPDDLKDRHPEVPWIFIKDFRNVAVHKYHRVNIKIVWDILKNKISILKGQIQEILDQKREAN